jgi:inner membrane transporter RhtA
MNTLFYLAVARLPLATVGAIEFVGTVALAVAGARTRRNAAALALTVAGVAALTVIRLAAQPLGFVFAFGNCACFVAYVVLGHQVANDPAAGADSRKQSKPAMSGVDQLGAAMLIAAVLAAPAGVGAALPAFTHPAWLAWGAGVGICSSVIPYVSDQLAMARLPRATFALMLALLPAIATLTGAVILGQIPTARDLAGIALVITGLAAHRPAIPAQEAAPRPSSSANPERRRDGLSAAGLGWADGVADRPGHDELRRARHAVLGARRRPGRSDHPSRCRVRDHLLRHGR